MSQPTAAVKTQGKGGVLPSDSAALVPPNTFESWSSMLNREERRWFRARKPAFPWCAAVSPEQRLVQLGVGLRNANNR